MDSSYLFGYIDSEVVEKRRHFHEHHLSTYAKVESSARIENMQLTFDHHVHVHVGNDTRAEYFSKFLENKSRPVGSLFWKRTQAYFDEFDRSNDAVLLQWTTVMPSTL